MVNVWIGTTEKIKTEGWTPAQTKIEENSKFSSRVFYNLVLTRLEDVLPEHHWEHITRDNHMRELIDQQIRSKFGSGNGRTAQK